MRAMWVVMAVSLPGALSRCRTAYFMVRLFFGGLCGFGCRRRDRPGGRRAQHDKECPEGLDPLAYWGFFSVGGSSRGGCRPRCSRCDFEPIGCHVPPWLLGNMMKRSVPVRGVLVSKVDAQLSVFGVSRIVYVYAEYGNIVNGKPGFEIPVFAQLLLHTDNSMVVSVDVSQGFHRFGNDGVAVIIYAGKVFRLSIAIEPPALSISIRSAY